MKKTMLAIGAFVLVSQAAQAQWSSDPYSPNYSLEQRHRDADYEFRSWQTEQRLHEQQRRMEDLEARQRLQQQQMDDTANRLRYERY
jgi:hypothetical protein